MAENKTKKLFSTVLADCPWSRSQFGNYGAINHYNLMPLDKIKAMPISDLAAPNSHLYLWVTNNAVPDGLEVLEAWGYRYITMFTWVKMKLGLGNYIRNSTEQVLFGVRGKLPVNYKSQPSWGLYGVQDHSHKPEEFHEVVKKLSPGPYLELFARRPYPGFSVWGNDPNIQSDVDIPGYPVPNLRKEA